MLPNLTYLILSQPNATELSSLPWPIELGLTWASSSLNHQPQVDLIYLDFKSTQSRHRPRTSPLTHLTFAPETEDRITWRRLWPISTRPWTRSWTIRPTRRPRTGTRTAGPKRRSQKPSRMWSKAANRPKRTIPKWSSSKSSAGPLSTNWTKSKVFCRILPIFCVCVLVLQLAWRIPVDCYLKKKWLVIILILLFNFRDFIFSICAQF